MYIWVKSNPSVAFVRAYTHIFEIDSEKIPLKIYSYFVENFNGLSSF